MEPVLTDTIMNGSDWVHQIKWDGISRAVLWSSNIPAVYPKRRERIDWYPELLAVESLLDCTEAVLDGELIVLDDSGKPSFYHVMARERVKRAERLKQYREKYPVQFMVFDILYRDGRDLRSLPLSERKAILDRTLRSEGPIQTVSDFPDGEALFAVMKEKGLEGIVSKHLSAAYIGGKNIGNVQDKG